MAKLSLQKTIIHSLFREEEPSHSIFWIYLRILATHLKDPEKEDLLQTSLMHRMLQLQELGLAAVVTNTLNNEDEPQGFAEASKSEAWLDSMREMLSSLINNQTWSLVNLSHGRTALRYLPSSDF